MIILDRAFDLKSICFVEILDSKLVAGVRANNGVAFLLSL